MALYAKKKKLTPGEVLMNRRAAIELEEANRCLTAKRAAAFGLDRIMQFIEGTSHTVQGAAPLVFQSLCRKEAINVYFTQEPKTDGKSIWLGPVDVTSPLAPVYVYGHGLHERHHVVYTDFSVIRQEMEVGVRTFLNVLEDIRVDRMGAEAYEGYLLWRRALFAAHESAGTAPWLKPEAVPFASKCTMLAHLYLTVEVLGVTELADAFLRVRSLVEDVMGEGTTKRFLSLVESSPRDTTAVCFESAKALWKFLRQHFRFARDFTEKKSEPVPTGMGPGGQFSLFAEDGSVSMDALPKEEMAELARKKAFNDARNSVYSTEDWDKGMTDDDAFRALMVSAESAGSDDTIGMCSSRLASEDDWRIGTVEIKQRMRKYFRIGWEQTAGLASVFRQTLLHRVFKANRLAEMGSCIADEELAMLPAGETRIFCKDGTETGRSLAVEILVDSSGSMTDTDMTIAKVTALRLLEAFRSIKGYEASVSLFPGASQKGVSLVADRHTSVREAIERCDFVASYGGTPILQALFAAAVRLDQSTADAKLCFVITDGWFADEQHVTEMLQTMEARGITTAMIGIGLSSKPMGKYVDRIECTSELPHAVRRLVEKLSRVLRFGVTVC